MTNELFDRLDAFELYRLQPEPAADDWKMAWAGVDLARSILDHSGREPAAADLGAMWQLLRAVEFADRRLGDAGKSSADDNGTTASRRVHESMGILARRAVFGATDTK